MIKRRTIYTVVLLLLGAGIAFCIGAIKSGELMDKENETLYSGYVSPANISNKNKNKYTDDAPINVDWAALQKKNNEVVGWIYVGADNDADIISYPVLYRKGDRDYYLHHNIDKQYSQYGVPYIPGDYDFLNRKLLSIHGHNFGSTVQTMFSPLTKYEQKDYTLRHPTIWYGKVGENVQPYTIFSVMQYDCTALDAGQTCWNYLQTSFTSDYEYAAWLSEAKAKSLFEIGGMPDVDDDVVILSTCQTAKATSVRCVVFAYWTGGDADEISN